MTPGPKEPTGPQLQNYMRLVVDDLLQLYDEGIIYHTPAYPQGELINTPSPYAETIHTRSKSTSCPPGCYL